MTIWLLTISIFMHGQYLTKIEMRTESKVLCNVLRVEFVDKGNIDPRLKYVPSECVEAKVN